MVLEGREVKEQKSYLIKHYFRFVSFYKLENLPRNILACEAGFDFRAKKVGRRTIFQSLLSFQISGNDIVVWYGALPFYLSVVSLERRAPTRVV
jgi:hypothetical protein